MAPLPEPRWILPDASPSISAQHEVAHALRHLGMRPSGPLSAFSAAQNLAVLIVGVTAASISLLAAVVTFQWFAFMKRSFRHQLIFLLIVSDLWKVVWYFIFPIVVFTKGKVESTSHFCQASGFFIALGTEASDYAILMIALHSALYVFRPPKVLGEGGLYPYRYWMYTFWIILPVLAASLAFTNPQGYITSGTYCALPKRPFWYRLGLSYIPRYIIFLIIFTLYGAISIYVHIKFKGFSDVGGGSSSSGTRSRNSTPNLGSFASMTRNMDSRKPSMLAGTENPENSGMPEWENINFITTAPTNDISSGQPNGTATADMVQDGSDLSPSTHLTAQNVSTRSSPTQHNPKLSPKDQRKESEVPTLATNLTGETRVSSATTQTLPTTDTANTDQLQDTRNAIFRQLRLLFVYPVVYVLMWVFPFVGHCLQYSDYFAAHPPFWLSIMSTCSLALQAGADCVVFSWREKPWRRVRRNGGRGKVAKQGIRKMSVMLGRTPYLGGKERHNVVRTGAGGGMGGGERPMGFAVAAKAGRKRDAHWWEEEGKKRKDSVWMGTDMLNQIISRQTQEEREEGEEAGDAARE